MRMIIGLLGLLFGFAANAGQITPQAPTGAAARTAANQDPLVSTLDSTANGGLRVYGDASAFDAVACYTTNNSAFCQSPDTATATNGNTLTVGALPPYIAGGANVVGTNIAASSNVASFTGQPGGPGTITLNNAPTGSVGAFNYSPPANVISFRDSGTITTNVSITLGAITVTTSTNFCKSEYAGGQISIPGAGPGGTVLHTIITACFGSQAGGGSLVFGIADQAGAALSAVPTTMTYGPNFATACQTGGFAATGLSGCVGMGMLPASWLGAGGGGASSSPVVINAVYAPNIIAVSVNGTQVINKGPAHFITGHDDSAAVNASCAYGKAAHIRTLAVPVRHYVPTISRLCYDFLLRGVGSLISSGGLRFDVTAGQTPPLPDPVVVPWNAPAPTPPRKEVVASVHLSLFRNSLNPAIANTYDSLSAPEANQISDLGTYPLGFLTQAQRQNPGLGLKMYYPGTSGGTLVNVMDAVPGVLKSPCITSTVTQWFAQMAANCPAQLFTVGGATNDGVGMSSRDLLDVTLKLQGGGYGGYFVQPRDIIFYTNHPQSRINLGAVSNGPTEDAIEDGGGILCSFAKVMGYPCIDGNVEGQKHVHGFDPLAMRQVRAFDVPYNTNAAALPYLYTRLIKGYGVVIGKAATAPSVWWATLTGNGGATDPRGPMLAFRISADHGNGPATVRLFWNSGNSTVGIECDANTIMVGIGCDDPATGLPPVKAAHILAPVTVANSGAGGVAVVTLGGSGTFQGCVAGRTVTLPGAGPSVTPPGLTAYVAPLITTVTSCDSSTQVTLAVAAGTTFAAVSEYMFWGNPVITSGLVSDPDPGNATGDEKIHFEVSGDDLVVWIGGPNNQLYAGKVMRGRGQFPPVIYSGGNRPTITFWGDLTSGGTTWTIAEPVPNLTDFTEDDVVGPSGNTPVSNSTYMGIEGGDGYAHNSTRYGRQVILPLFAAQDFGLGNGGVSVNVNSGAAFTVPNCLVGTVYVNDTTAPTINLPAYCASPMVVQDSGGQAAAHNITVAAPSGVTLNGTATITSNFGARTIRWTGPNAAVSQ